MGGQEWGLYKINSSKVCGKTEGRKRLRTSVKPGCQEKGMEIENRHRRNGKTRGTGGVRKNVLRGIFRRDEQETENGSGTGQNGVSINPNEFF